MVNLSLTLLLVLLVLLILLSSFFSGSETGMMALNRYRLRHLARKNNRFAMIVSKLLDRPDRLLGIILIGNTFANIVASAVATVIAARLYGDWGIALGTLLLTLIILIFAEVTPKTLAAAYPQKIAFFAAYPLNWLLKIFYPIVFFVNSIANGILKIFHVPIKTGNLEKLTSEELSTVVTEAGSNIPQIHQDMLVAILRLENVKVEDVMIPRAKAIGIDITLDINTILSKLADAPFTQLPLYAEDINHIKGVIDIHQAFKLLAKNPKLNKSQLLRIAEEPYFIP
ncbi:MAG: CNNM domain-containing protein, partial [Pseudomonadota bacterium]